MVPEDTSSQSSLFDPNEKSVAEVQAHLDQSNQEERERVWATEEAGKNRVTVMNYEPTSSDDEDEESEEGDGSGGEDDVDTSPEDLEEKAEEVSEEVASGSDVPDDYSPYTDPLVPSSTLADSIAAELQSGEGSPTLQALHDNKKEDAPKDDKSTS